MGDIEFEFGGRRVFNDVARALGRVNRQLPRQILRDIEKEAKALRKQAAAKALEEPAFGDKHTGLRKNVAKGIKVVPVEEGGRSGYRVITTMPEEDEAIIPRGFDNRKGWRHPVFGRREQPWVTQHGAFSWFMDTMQEAGPRLTSKIHEDIEDAADEIDRAAHG